MGMASSSRVRRAAAREGRAGAARARHRATAASLFSCGVVAAIALAAALPGAARAAILCPSLVYSLMWGDTAGATFTPTCGGGSWRQLTSHLSGDTTWAKTLGELRCYMLAREAGGYDTPYHAFAEGDMCAVRADYTQVTTYLPGDTQHHSSGTADCHALGGYYFYPWCAVRGQYTEITNYLTGDPERARTPMGDNCTAHGGRGFGEGNMCVLPGEWSQLTMRLPGDKEWAGRNPCERIATGAARSFQHGADGSFCTVEGRWTQLTTRLVGDKAWSSFSEDDCEARGGMRFGVDDSFCVLEGAWTQLSTRLPHQHSSVAFPAANCTASGGFVFGEHDEFCAVPGDWAQLTTRIVGDTTFPAFNASACDEFGGFAFGTAGEFCAVENDLERGGVNYHEFVTKVPGAPSWSPMTHACDEINGVSLHNGAYCAIRNNVDDSDDDDDDHNFHLGRHHGGHHRRHRYHFDDDWGVSGLAPASGSGSAEDDTVRFSGPAVGAIVIGALCVVGIAAVAHTVRRFSRPGSGRHRGAHSGDDDGDDSLRIVMLDDADAGAGGGVAPFTAEVVA
mmetsp:Transcript_11722/g.41048  ORF Transcript_11722/g.41048 Transcript_11722/m.41048 type:complete len:564 (-) Transcript_11722:118-1809(-)